MYEWETVQVSKRKPHKPAAPKPEPPAEPRVQSIPTKVAASNASKEPQQKWGGGQNRQHTAVANTARLDEETEELKHQTMPLSVGKIIQQGRQAKGWSQKELATRCNEKPQIINDYEAGRGIPNPAILQKIERVLGTKLKIKKKPNKESSTGQLASGRK